MNRYSYYDANLQPCEGGTAEHLFTADHQQNLTFAVDFLGGKPVRNDKAEKLIAECRLAGLEDWRGPEAHEEFLVRDLTRFDPALDPIAFPRQPTMGFVWTRTPAAWSINPKTGTASAVWGVGINGGSSGTLSPDYTYGFVRAVRSGVPGGQ